MGLLSFFKKTSEFTKIQNAIEQQAAVLVSQGKKAEHLKGTGPKEKNGQAAAFAAGQLLDLFFTWYTRANSGNQDAYLRYQDSDWYGCILIDKYLELVAISIQSIGERRAKSGITFWTCLPFDLMQLNGVTNSGSVREALTSKETPFLSVNAVCSVFGEELKPVFWNSLKGLLADRFEKHSSEYVKHHAHTLREITKDAVLGA